MKLIVLILVAALLSCVPASIEPVRMNEADHVRSWCMGEIEHVLPDTHAIEFDWADNWYSGVGQALHYAEVSGRAPGLVLILRRPSDARHVARARKVTQRSGIKLWVIGVDK